MRSHVGQGGWRKCGGGASGSRGGASQGGGSGTGCGGAGREVLTGRAGEGREEEAGCVHEVLVL